MGPTAGGAEIAGDIAPVGNAEDQAFQTFLPLSLLRLSVQAGMKLFKDLGIRQGADQATINFQGACSQNWKV